MKNGQASVFDQSFLRLAERRALGESFPVIYGVDLFCGCGGLSLGVQEACFATGYRFESLLALDNDTSCLEVYNRNFHPRYSYDQDIWDVVDGELGARPKTCETELLKKLDEIDICLAGPPCQGHSGLNNHTRRKDRRNKLYERVGRFAEVTRPKHILVENVPAIVHGHDRALSNTIGHLIECGYFVDTGVVDLSKFGVPQRRKRHILIASLYKKILIKEVVERHRVAEERSVEWAIGDLERVEAADIFNEPSKHSKENLKRFKFLLDNDRYDLPNHLRPRCHRNGGHSYKSMYGRLKYDNLAQTITSGYGSPGQGRFIHPTQPRTLTPHEAARLQFFPDFFDFSSVKKRTALANMIGNAVPMVLSYVFTMELLA